MAGSSKGTALVIGVGPGLGAALCRALGSAGYTVAAMGRSLKPTAPQAAGAHVFAADASDPGAVGRAVVAIESKLGALDVLVYNASGLEIAPPAALSPEKFEAVWRVSCLGAFVAARAVLPLMEARGHGSALFTGATASLRGGANFAAFASAKFALRGLVQSLARTYGPKGVHVAHAIIDGQIGTGDDRLHPDDIARAYLNVIDQPRSSWTQEFDLRPFSERY